MAACSFDALYGATTVPTDVHPRSTLQPEQDFILVPLSRENVAALKQSIFPRIGLSERVVHILISRGGQLVFWSYDCFHRDCVGVEGAFDRYLLTELKNRNVLHEFGEFATEGDSTALSQATPARTGLWARLARFICSAG